MDESAFDSTFFQARLKVNRANRHISEAQEWFAAHVGSDFYDIVDNRDPETGRQTICAQAEGIPAHMVLAIGDAFHCLSSALDYVMSGLMRAKTGNSGRIHFPADETRKGLRKSFMPPKPTKSAPANRRVMKAFPLIALEILTVIQPYKGGKFGLWEIRKADNIDKHNLIMPTITITEIRGLRMVDKVHNNVFEPGLIQVGPGGRMNLMGYLNPGGTLEFEDKGHATASISFPDGLEVFAGKPVFPTLLECSQLVAETLDRIEAVARRYL
ncbi:hypothetical protein [Tsuneonella sp. SYSU-LHT278]|uniref:hypothetical protein n=1 Tax=Tsuneonella sediminis TaxID=3416089 RepID=UPI003F7A26FE